MSLYKGTTPIAGLAVNKIMAGRFLLEAIWSDHIINDIQYLRADTFSWQSGIVYTAAYNKLVEEYTSGTEETKDGVTFRRSENGFKIADASQENAIASKYTDTGVAWYYILDTENKQFKLPRTKFNFVGLRDNAGDYVNESLPNIKASWQRQSDRNVLGPNDILTGAFKRSSSESTHQTFGDSGSAMKGSDLLIDAHEANTTYQDNAPVQQRATQMYLYFFVGNFSQTAIEQTAGVATEALNDLNAKIDGEWVINTISIINTETTLTLGNGQIVEYDISSYLPNDNNVYSLWVEILGNTGAATNAITHLWVTCNTQGNQGCSCGARAYSATRANIYGNGEVIVPKGVRTLRLCSTSSTAAPTISVLRIMRYRKVR